jgi:uncharacterized protein YhaN
MPNEKKLPSDVVDPVKMSEIKENEIKDLLAKSEISLSLDTYDDIFSDFDPRTYAERALSDDFLMESRKAARDKKSAIELKFLVPEKQRNTLVEQKIKKRLREHFKRHKEMLEKEAKDYHKKGIVLTIVGFILMAFATMISEMDVKNFWMTFLVVMLEPAGWFIVWYGLDQIFYAKKEHKSELDFYKKMANANISFISY